MLSSSDSNDRELSFRLQWLFRLSIFFCFLGHGAFGILTKSAWLPYFALVGIKEGLAYELMPMIGAMDILTGLVALICPCRAILSWATFWCLWTALLRPLCGQGIWEFVERAGNYGVPLAFLILAGRGGLWQRLSETELKVESLDLAKRSLRLSLSALLLGHAATLGYYQRPDFFHHFSALGLEVDHALLLGLGIWELLLAFMILLSENQSLLFVIIVWKVFTESLFWLSGSPPWEFVERAGNYAVPLALIFFAKHAKDSDSCQTDS